MFSDLLHKNKTFTNLFFLGIISAGVPLVFYLHPENAERIEDMAAIALGFILLSGFFFAVLLKKLKLPLISGYLLAGIFFGPSLAKMVGFPFPLVSMPVLNELSLIDDIALGLIAFTAGGELKLTEMQGKWIKVFVITLIQGFFVFAGIVLVSSLFGNSFLPAEMINRNNILAFALMLGVISTATSPATVIAVVKEFRAKGALTNMIMSIIILQDIIFLISFAVILSLTKTLIHPVHVFDFRFFLQILWEMVGSVLFGGILGSFLVFYIKKINIELALLIPGLAFLSMYLGGKAHLSGLIICLIAGIIVENFSSQGKALFAAIEKSSLPVFIIFFFIAGARIDLEMLKLQWFVALSLVLVRMIFGLLGASFASSLMKEDTKIRKYAWSGAIGQAGIALGFASILAKALPGIGMHLQQLILGMIAFNQILGPILLAWGLNRAGEGENHY